MRLIFTTQVSGENYFVIYGIFYCNCVLHFGYYIIVPDIYMCVHVHARVLCTCVHCTCRCVKFSLQKCQEFLRSRPLSSDKDIDKQVSSSRKKQRGMVWCTRWLFSYLRTCRLTNIKSSCVSYRRRREQRLIKRFVCFMFHEL